MEGSLKKSFMIVKRPLLESQLPSPFHCEQINLANYLCPAPFWSMQLWLRKKYISASEASASRGRAKP
jgi:hypothetical protein